MSSATPSTIATAYAAASSVSPCAGPAGVSATEYLQVYIKTTFGPVVQIVVSSLLIRGRQSLDELYHHTRLDMPTLKRCLLTLVQQDIVHPAYDVVGVRPGSKKKAPRVPRVLYTLMIDSLRARPRYASYLLWVRQSYGIACEFILQTLLVNGKMSSDQLINTACASMEEQKRASVHEQHRQHLKQMALAAQGGLDSKRAMSATPPPTTPFVQDRRAINDDFRRLIAARFIITSSGLTPPVDPNSDAATTAVAAPSSSASTAATAETVRAYILNSARLDHEADIAAEEAAAVANGSAPAAASSSSSSSSSSAAASSSSSSSSSSAASSRKRKVIRDDDDDESAKEEKPIAKKGKKKTKKEIDAEKVESDKAEAEAMRIREAAETDAALSSTHAAASSSSSSSFGASAPAAPASDAHLLWSVNHSAFLWEFRKRAVVDYVNTSISPAAGWMVQQMMAAYPHECADRLNPERPPIYDAEQIVDMCKMATQAANDAAGTQNVNPIATVDLAEGCIHELLGDASGFFERKSHPKGFSINFTTLFAALRTHHLQSLCRTRFGSLSARIFRCLLQHKRLEETQISEYATAPRKDVRRLLYELHHANFITMQEVPRTADRMPSKTFFIWGVNVKSLEEHYLERSYFAWCNLRLRLEVETEKAKPILDKVDTSMNITEAEKGIVDKWKKSADRLESGINQINQIIMMFQDM